MINNGIGEVALNGSLTVNPTQTTTYTITATGPGGSATASATVDVRTIDINITSPFDGGSLTGSSTMVTGTLNNPAGTETGVTVNGIPASMTNNQFVANHVSLTPGQNTITVTATDINGTKATRAITVNATPATNYIKVSAYPDSGTSPLEVTLRINGSFSITNPSITFTGPAEIEQLAAANPDEYQYKITTEGIYYFTAQAIGPDNNTYQDTVAVTVLSLAQIDLLLQTKWSTLNSALQNSDTAQALTQMLPEKRDNYQRVFVLLSNQWPLIIAGHTGFTLISVDGNRAKYELTAMKNGKEYAYEIIFVRDSTGLWRIEEY